MSEQNKPVTFTGTVARQIYGAEDDFRIYAMNVDKTKYPNVKFNKYGNVSIQGELSELMPEMVYEITGEEIASKYGYSYKVINIRCEEPDSAHSMYLFLSQVLTQNQADALWEHYPDIVSRVKEDRLDDVDLSKLHGIGEKNFEVIKRKILETYCLADLVTEFSGYFSFAVLRKLYQRYTSVDIIKKKLREDPYKCLCALAGIGFVTADKLLLGLEKTSEASDEPIIVFDNDLRTSRQRCLSCLLYLLQENEDDGHTKMDLAECRSRMLDVVPECIEHFPEAIKDQAVYYCKDTMEIALSHTWTTEKYIADTIRENIENADTVWDYDVERYRMVDGVRLSDEQMTAVQNVCRHNISILNGAAGVGKSFGTQAIINMLEDNHRSYRLFSPTGKAAKVLADYTKRTASTIHRGLGYRPASENPWTLNKNNPLKCDIVIVDEFSMVDIWLFSHLIDAVDFTQTKLLMIGDNAQLCSVGCGNLLHDFMASGTIPSVTLTKVFRYGEGGLMKVATDVRFCKPYLSNSMKKSVTTFGTNKDYTFVDMSSEETPKQAKALYKKLLDKGYGVRDIQVLTAKNVGDCGTVVLNNIFQKVANPNYGSQNNMVYGETTYYEGDLVMQRVNNYKAEIDRDSWSEADRLMYDNTGEKPTAFVANGESGIIKEVAKTYILIDFDGIVVRYKKDDLKDVSLGYCITIHKSQGSSIKAVILLTPQSHTFMLNSNLIYVGLTRMKEVCYHLGTLTSVNQAIVKKANLERNTFMQNFLKDTVDK